MDAMLGFICVNNHGMSLARTTPLLSGEIN
jgi:hypothetical protein